LSRIALIALALAIAPCAGAARAGAPEALRAAVFARAPVPPPPDRPLAVHPSDAPLLRPAGVARTSLDAAFADHRGAASVGFLCGLDERAETSGGMGAFGADPQGRFVGAKLTLKLR
jgi:hypothetical protein